MGWDKKLDCMHMAEVGNGPMYFAVSEEDMQAKKDAMNCYEFESRKFPHPRAGESLDALAKYRGVQVGCERAEAFQIIRHLM